MYETGTKMYGIVLLFFLTRFIVQSEVIYTYEFERSVGGAGKSRSPWRSRASDVSALHMFKGDVVEMKLCVNQVTYLSIVGLNYSNDGDSDYIVFELDGVVVGDLVTNMTRNGWGHHWNTKKMIRRIGNPFYVSMGTHILRIKAESTDCYGSELDRLRLASSRDNSFNIFCGVSFVQSKQPTPCAVALDALFTTTPATVSTTTEAPPILVQQLSFESNCLDHHNVAVRFRVKKLKGTEIIAKSNKKPKRELNILTSSASKHVNGRACDRIIWQIGETNRRNDELGPIWPEDHIDYDVNSHVHEDQRAFPKAIKPKQTDQVVMRYVVPGRIKLKDGQVRFTLGLVNVSESINIGLQFYRRHRRNPSRVKNITFTTDQQVMGWVLPVRAISPSLENQLVLHFDKNSKRNIQFDFLRLEYISTPIRPTLLMRPGIWNIYGRKVQRGSWRSSRRFKSRGMYVVVNGYNKRGKYEIADLIRYPNREVISVYRNGEIYPTHESRFTKKKSRKGYFKLKDVTGFKFGTQEVSRVNFNIYKRLITITYTDSSIIKLSYWYTQTRTRLRIEDVRMNPKVMTFFSNYVSPNNSAIDELTVDNKINMHIMDTNINGLVGNSFKFENNAHSPVFGDVSDVYEVNFPE